ncbi:MAG TPA: hypothetical protein VFI31_25245 [Pirellulales bacterium]|nr:hypothetical protein [Pirellulales bacterium]
MRTWSLLAATALVFVAARLEAGIFCHHCGCQTRCKKVCRLVCEKKEEKKTAYSCECEDFCIPGPSKKCGVKVECDCNGHHRTILWKPACAKVHTRKKLVKKETKKEVPNYKWEVDVYCCVCGRWVKVEKNDDGKKTRDGDSGKDSKSSPRVSREGGESQVAPLDGPPPIPKSDDSLKDDPASEDEDGNFKPERLPVPPAEREARQTMREPATDSYPAYYIGGELPTKPEPVDPNEPRRLFFDLLRR